MKVVILAGGFGTRISEESQYRPKPMVEIGGKPILWHIMDNYARQGFNDFIIALGYKSEVIKDYFYNYYGRNSDFSVNLSKNEVTYLNRSDVNWNVTLVNTGLNSMTGGRLFNLRSILSEEENFLLTYGDGLCNVKVSDVISLHESKNAIATLTAVRPTARFGNLEMEGSKVLDFKEKPQTEVGRINGGFFVFNKKVFDYLNHSDNVLEKEPLEEIAKHGKLFAHQHDGFWQCMDTLRDKIYLESICEGDKSPWIVR